MARSMTAYGRAHAQTTVGLFLIEIHSVNRKSLDINIYLPKEFLALDMRLRRLIADRVKRGYVTVRVIKEGKSGERLELPPLEVLKTLHVEWNKYAQELGYDLKEAIPFSMMMQMALDKTFSVDTLLDETVEEDLVQGFQKALDPFIEMKEVEGKALLADIFPRLKSIEEEIETIKGLSAVAPQRYQDRLAKKLSELRVSHEMDEERLAREVVLFADKIDVTEEMTRLSSHVTQCQELLKGDKLRIGRELDFLIQEMHRETNTIAAKSQELAITQATLRVKSGIEKIREQLANIE